MLLRCADKTLDLSRPIVMGVVNVTPDSFSDGGQFTDLERAVAHALQMIEEGAALIDVGGESTRPGAAPVSVDEEQLKDIMAGKTPKPPAGWDDSLSNKPPTAPAPAGTPVIPAGQH